MKVFISWSGDMSRKIAQILGDWLPDVIQAVKPFVSSEDISAGDRWAEILAAELEETRFGILCITPFNLRKTWLNFEAGALSKAVDRSLVVPLLFGVERSCLQGPLEQFQSLLCTQDDILALLETLNRHLADDSRLSTDRLRRSFLHWWPVLEKALKAVEGGPGETETDYPWLFTSEDLARMELVPRSKSIWVVTPSPYRDLQLECVSQALRKNLHHGVRYTFIVPENEATEEARDSLNHLFPSHPDQIEVREVPQEEFDRLAVTHYIVLDPDHEQHYTPRVFLELPILRRGYWVEVSPGAAENFAVRFRGMLKDRPWPGQPLGTGDEPAAGPLPS